MNERLTSSLDIGVLLHKCTCGLFGGSKIKFYPSSQTSHDGDSSLIINFNLLPVFQLTPRFHR